MSKPSKPTPPREPKAPERIYVERSPASFSVYDQTLAQIMETIKGQYARWDTQSKTMTRVPCVPTMEEVTVTLEHDHSDDGSHIEAQWNQAWTVTLTDAEYDRLMAKHEADMSAYYTKLAIYQTALTQYEVDLAKWEADKRVAAEAKRRAQYEALKTEFKETNP